MILIVLYILSVVITFFLTSYQIKKKGFKHDFISIVYPFIPIANLGWSLGVLITILIDKRK